MKYILLKIDEKTNRPVGFRNPYKGYPNHAAASVNFLDGADTIIACGKEIDFDEAKHTYDSYIIDILLQCNPDIRVKSFSQFMEEYVEK